MDIIPYLQERAQHIIVQPLPTTFCNVLAFVKLPVVHSAHRGMVRN